MVLNTMHVRIFKISKVHPYLKPIKPEFLEVENENECFSAHKKF